MIGRPAPDFDICVLGGGAAGLSVAAGAARLGARAVLVEKDRLGGECLYSGCVPSKALLRSAHVASLVRRAADFGLEVPPSAPPDLPRIMRRVDEVIAAIEPHDSPERFRRLGVEVIEGAGCFADPRHVIVNDRPVSARRFVIATGSAPSIPPIRGLDRIPYLTNETLFTVREPLPRLAIIGAGAVGVEMAQAFVRLGSRVTLFEAASRILPAEDPDTAGVVVERLHRDGVHLVTGVRIDRVHSDGNGGLRIAYDDGHEAGPVHAASHLLVATGRRPVLEGLDLKAAGVHCHGGQLVVDRRLRTTQSHIYACGDVIGPYRFTHMAEHQAGVVLRNALFHLPAHAARDAIPSCIFTDPELARVGLSEEQARREGISHKVLRVPFSRTDRALTDGETAGFAKILTGSGGRLLGAAIVGAHAGELIHEFALAITQGLRAADVSATIHIYPALAQINRFVADEVRNQRLTPARRRWLQRLFRLRGN